MGYLKFDKTQLINLEYSLSREILRSNRSGSYASTTLVGCNTRKYHGLLVSPMKHLDNSKHVLLSTADISLIQHDTEFELGIHKFQGDLYIPKGHSYIRDFEIEGVPKLEYRVGGMVITRESLLVEKQEQILIRITILEGGSKNKLKIKPFLAFRNIHELSKANLHANTKSKPITHGIKIRLYDGYPYLHIQTSKEAEFVHTPDWYYNVEYLEEQRRGYEFKEDLFMPGYFEIPVKKRDEIIFSASTTEDNPSNFKRKFTNELSKRIPRDNFRSDLINAAQQFFDKKEKTTEIIAGFPWFGSCTRDALISLPGLTFIQEEKKLYHAVLESIQQKLKEGLLPVSLSEEDASYAAADIPLWFIWAVQQYSMNYKEYLPVWKKYGKAIKTILNSYKKGTSFNICMHDNGLVYAGEQGIPLTWMNAVVEGKPVTLRAGYAIEINALWYNAVKFSLDMAGKAKDQKFISSWQYVPQLIEDNFTQLFWDTDKQYLADVVTETEKDWSVRPNQVIAIALPYTPVNNEIIREVLNYSERVLLTIRGLRSLSPNEKNYEGVFNGNQIQRDLAYHQGTVWPWLLQFYGEAHVKLYKKRSDITLKKILKDIEPAMNEHGIGTLSEMYNGNPPHQPKGAISQAWSVAAVLYLVFKTEILEQIEE